jgi:branched-chain amino acid transport system ATP-binding protein
MPAHARAALGIGYMPEDRGLVPELTVEENIVLPLWVSPTLSLSERLAWVYEVLPELKEMSTRRALLLSGGQQKLVALARALAVGTRLLLLDEPFEGVAPALSMRLSDVIGQLKSTDLSVLIAQSDVNHANDLLDAQVVIERGANAA